MSQRSPLDKKIDLYFKRANNFGCLRGFVHFSVSCRGREEVLVTIYFPQKKSSNVGQDYQFLVGLYDTYKRPYVWILSDHLELPGGEMKIKDKAAPLELFSTQDWDTQSTHIRDIVLELLDLCLPNLKNPFQINHNLFTKLDSLEQVIYSGALIDFLQAIFVAEIEFSNAIYEDFQKLIKIHYASLEKLNKRVVKIQNNSR